MNQFIFARTHVLLGILAILLPGHSSAQIQNVGAYRLKPDDQIRLTVFQEPDLQTEVKLTAAGDASFPLIGAVHLAGKSLQEAEFEITALYDADYLVKPKLSINLVNAAAEVATVTGAVAKPGEVVIPPNSTLDLVSAIDWAGGLTPQADERRIEMKRGEVTRSYNLATLRAKGAAQVILQNGDRINVPASAFAGRSVTIVGAVNAPGAVAFPVNGKLDLDTAIGVAGGLTEAADSSRVTVKRDGKVYSAQLGAGNRALAPGDVISVPQSRFVGKVVTIMGQVGKPGPLGFPVDGKLDVLNAVARAGGFSRLANKKRVLITRQAGGQNQTWRLDLSDMAEGKVDLFYLVPGDTVSIPERRF